MRYKKTTLVSIIFLGLVTWSCCLPPSGNAAKGFSQAGTELRIGFWNLRSLENSSRVRDDIKQIAKILHSMDCVALGEVYDDFILGKLVNELMILGGEWDKVRAPRRVGSPLATAELYGFLFRNDKLEVRGRAHVMPRKWIRIQGIPVRHRFEHPPFVCTFATLDDRFDFTVAVVQITAGKDVSLARIKPPPPPELYQEAEVDAMADYFNQVQLEDEKENDVFLLGHFRVNKGDSSLNRLLGIPGMIDTPSGHVPTAIDSLTTHDQIFFQTNYCREYTGANGVDKFDELFFYGNVQKARLAYSDYRPIWVNMRVPEKDDD